jgi:hypothetical protein
LPENGSNNVKTGAEKKVENTTKQKNKKERKKGKK